VVWICNTYLGRITIDQRAGFGPLFFLALGWRSHSRSARSGHAVNGPAPGRIDICGSGKVAAGSQDAFAMQRLLAGAVQSTRDEWLSALKNSGEADE
jgi:hypothetical protein